MEIRIRGWVFRQGGVPQRLDTLEALDQIGGDQKRFVWLDFEGGTEPEMESELADRMQWHPIVMQHIRMPGRKPRLNHFEDYAHLTLMAPNPAGKDSPRRLVDVDCVLGHRYLMTFHRRPMASLDTVLSQAGDAKRLVRGPDLLLQRIVTALIDQFSPQVQDMDEVLGELEEEALENPRPDLLERIVLARDELYMMHLAMAPQVPLLGELSSGASRLISAYARPFFRSAEIRLRGLLDDIATYKEVAQNALELYRSAITHKTNEIIRLLTVISTPLLILTFITGLYGMNVSLPGAGSQHAFTVIAFLSGGIFVGLLAFFKRSGWI